MVSAAPRLRDDVIDLEDSERELRPAAVAEALLLAEQDVLVLAVGNEGVYVRAPGNVRAGGDVAVVEQAAHGLLEAHVDQLDGFRGYVDAYPLAAQLVGGDAGGGAAAEGVENDVALIAAGLDDAFEQGQGFLGWVADTFVSLRVNRRNVDPYVVGNSAWIGVQVAFESWNLPLGSVVNHIRLVEGIESRQYADGALVSRDNVFINPRRIFPGFGNGPAAPDRSWVIPTPQLTAFSLR